MSSEWTRACTPFAFSNHQSPLTTHHSLLLHSDATQAVGKIPVDFRHLGVDTLSFSGHKFHGPRGIGAVVIRRGVQLRPLFWGGHQQQARRPGTEPVALVVGLAKALELACRDLQIRQNAVSRLRAQLLKGLRVGADPLVLNGPDAGGLPHTINVSFPGCPAELLLMKLDLAGVACSTGSACSSGSLQPSPVLRAMGRPAEILHSSLRLSLSYLTTHREIATATERICLAVKGLRESPSKVD